MGAANPFLLIENSNVYVGTNYGIRAGGIGTVKIIDNTITGNTSTWSEGFQVYK